MSFLVPEKVEIIEVKDLDGDDTPGVSEFSNFNAYDFCIAKGLKYTSLTLKIQSSTYTADAMSSEIREILEHNIKNFKESDIKEINTNNININLYIDKLSNPKIDKKDLSTEDLLILENKSQVLLDDLDYQLKEAQKIIDSIMVSIINTEYLELFKLLDNLQTFINDVNYIDTYYKYKVLHKELTKNSECIPIKKYIQDDGFLYYDSGKKNFILPLDMNNGKVRVKKFFPFLNSNERKVTKKIEEGYFKYLVNKKKILISAGDRVKYLYGIQDDKNPYYVLSNSVGTKVEKPISLLV